MTTRPTPGKGIRYPVASSTVDAADLQTMANDLDGMFTADDTLRQNALRRPSCYLRGTAAASVAKATQTTFSFDTIDWDNTGGAVNLGAGAPANQRITPNIAGIWYVWGYVELNTASASGMTTWEVTVSKNGLLTNPNYYRTKIIGALSPLWGTLPAQSGGLMQMNGTTDYFNLIAFWNGTPAGPFNTSSRYLMAMLVST